MRILVVEDEVKLAGLLRRGLTEEGLSVDVARSGDDGLWMARATDYDAIVLDVMLPGTYGLEVCRQLREAGRWAPVLMLTARDAVEDRVSGLDAGADDYLPKPFEPRELLARIRSVLRRLEAPAPTAGPAPRLLPFGRCRLDLDARRLLDGAGAEVALTAMEFDLLATFARHPRQVLSRSRLSELAHNRPLDPDDRSVDIRITRLRRKIEPDPAQPTVIRTTRGEGYLYDPDAPAA
jgi:DNA-binding response OmpR family regulator